MLLTCLVVLLTAPVDTLDTFEAEPGAIRRVHRPYVIRMVRTCKGASWELIGTAFDSGAPKAVPDTAGAKQEDHTTAWQNRRAVHSGKATP